MDTVTNQEEIEQNLAVLENYLCDGSEDEQRFAHELIRQGTCFVAYQINGELRFAPSRYIGYLDNNRAKHEEERKRKNIDGRETNDSIKKIFDKKQPIEDINLDKGYEKFATSLGIDPTKKQRKYWRLNVDHNDFTNNEDTNEGFPEGKLVERTHKSRERDSSLVATAKDKFIKKYQRLYCQACDFDFESTYGDRGKGYIEAHHTIPVCEMEPYQKTNVEDIALVCSNCHRILHRTRPWITMGKLKSIVKKHNNSREFDVASHVGV